MSLIIPANAGINVDARYSAIFEPNLYHNSWLVPGVTCTDKYKEVGAGQIYVHKLKSTGETEPGTPGRDFSHVNASDDLIPIMLNNNFMESDKIYRVALNSIGANVADEMLSNVVMKIRGGYNQSGLACLVTEGTPVSGPAITAATAKKEILATRTSIVKKKGRANVVLCSPDTYSVILEAAGDKFTPVMNERINDDGQVGRWLGMTFIEASGLSAASAKYNNSAGASKTASFAGIDFVMYYHEAFSAVGNLEIFRIVDGGKDFNGSIAQGELNVGYKVTNADLVAVRKTTA